MSQSAFEPPAVRLDRHTEQRRDPQLLAERFAQARVLRVDRAGRVEPVEPTGVYDSQRHVVVGQVGEQWWFCERADLDHGLDVRAATEVPDELEDVLYASLAVLNWHDTEPRCHRCASLTQRSDGGWMRVCVACGHEEFPRQDPAMIVAVLDADDRLLLAHQASWPPNRASVLAGFVEAGESIEDSVVREVFEEVGLVVTAVRYLASRAWPFPRSLMFGCVARAEGDLRPDGTEISWARWYTPDEFAAAIDAGELSVSTSALAMSPKLIAEWRAGRLGALL